MSSYRNLTEATARHGTERPQHNALILVGGDGAGWGRVVRRVTYAELDRDARRIAGWLGNRYPRGERVLIQVEDQRLFAVCVLGCLYAGMAAVPAPAPNGPRNARRRVTAMARDASVRVLLTEQSHAGEAVQELVLGGVGVECAPVDGLLQGSNAPDAADWTLPDLEPSSIALLQYTSGSTKVPRGVVIEHRQLLANHAQIQAALNSSPDSIFGGWLPLHHDMGLIGQLLHPLYLGATTVLMTPDAFARDPGRWPRMLSEHRVEVTGAPNTGYQLCVERAREQDLRGIDLSALRVAVNGGEPVRAATLRAFFELFEPHGLSPGALRAAYGLAEATLLVSCADAGEAGRTLDVDQAAFERGQLRPAANDRAHRALAGSGRVRGLDARIVDPETSTVAAPGRIGEIWLRGESVGADYWRHPPGTARTFRGTLPGLGEGFLKTGDLGVIHEGELYVTGRSSELIIIAGRNLHPVDVETAVRKVSPSFGAAVAFGVEPADAPEQLAVVLEVQSGRAPADADRTLEQLAAGVRERVAADFAVGTGAVVLVRPGTVRRTTSGKLERTAVRRLFLEGRVEALYELLEPPVRAVLGRRAPQGARSGHRPEPGARPPRRTHEDKHGEDQYGRVLLRLPREQRESVLRHWLADGLGRLLRRPDVAADAVLADLGLDSVLAAGLAGDIEARFRVRVPASVAFDHRTIGEIAAYVCDLLEKEEASA